MPEMKRFMCFSSSFVRDFVKNIARIANGNSYQIRMFHIGSISGGRGSISAGRGVHICWKGVHICWKGVPICWKGVHICWKEVHIFWKGVHICRKGGPYLLEGGSISAGRGVHIGCDTGRTGRLESDLCDFKLTPVSLAQMAGKNSL